MRHKPMPGTELRTDHHWSVQNLVGFWPLSMGGGLSARDIAGGNNGEIIGATWVPGRDGQALSSDGDNDFVDLGNNIRIKPYTGDMTWNIWINPDTDIGGRAFMGDRLLGALGTQEGYSIGGAGGDQGNIDIHLEAADHSIKLYRKTPAYTIGEGWFNLVVTWNNGTDTLLIYKNGVDGTALYTKNNDDNLSGKDISNAENVYIGWRPAAAGRYFSGLFSHVSIYSVALTAAQVMELYINPHIMFQPEWSPMFAPVAAPVGVVPQIQFLRMHTL